MAVILDGVLLTQEMGNEFDLDAIEAGKWRIKLKSGQLVRDAATGEIQIDPALLTQLLEDVDLLSGVLDPATLALKLTDDDGGEVTVSLLELKKIVSANTPSIALTGTGESADPLKANLVVDPIAGNPLVVGLAGAKVDLTLLNALIPDAANGLTTNAAGVDELGGTLTKPTTIETTAANTLALAGLQAATTPAFDLVVDAAGKVQVSPIVQVENLIEAFATTAATATIPAPVVVTTPTLKTTTIQTHTQVVAAGATITLPNATLVPVGVELLISTNGTWTGVVGVATTAGQLIDGATTYSFAKAPGNAQENCPDRIFKSTGTGWAMVSGDRTDAYSYPAIGNAYPAGVTVITPATNTPANSPIIVDGAEAFRVADGNYLASVSLPPVSAASKPITIRRESSFGLTLQPTNTDLDRPLIFGGNEIARFVPAGGIWRWVDPSFETQVAANPPNYAGTATPGLVPPAPVAPLTGKYLQADGTWQTITVLPAANGLTTTAGVDELGGALTKPTTITTTAANTIALAGIQTATAPTVMMVQNAAGVVQSALLPPKKFHQVVALVANTPFTVTHNLGLAQPKAFTKSYVDANGFDVSLKQGGETANSYTITSNVAIANLNITVMG